MSEVFVRFKTRDQTIRKLTVRMDATGKPCKKKRNGASLVRHREEHMVDTTRCGESDKPILLAYNLGCMLHMQNYLGDTH
jgi:hypothetical protein